MPLPKPKTTPKPKSGSAQTESTASKQLAPQLKPFHFRPGQSGNPAGRKKGSRNKLGEDFLAALQKDFEEHGEATIQTVRQERPHEYLKVIAGILPKELNVKAAPLAELSDEELEAAIALLKSAIVELDEPQTQH